MPFPPGRPELYAHAAALGVVALLLLMLRPRKRSRTGGSPLLVKRITETATIPTKSSEGAAGLDLRSDVTCVVNPHAVTPVRTGVALKIPAGSYGRICSRPGLLKRRGVEALTGVVDRDYTGEVVVFLRSHRDKQVVWPGDKIGRIIFEKHEECVPIDVGRGELRETARGDGGFGSTGW